LLIDLDDLHLAASRSKAVCTVELAQSPRRCSLAPYIGALVFDVFNERAQLGQDLTSPWVIEKNPRRDDGEGRQ
jgi:hypothetical protein